MADLQLFGDAIAEISARLDLRQPNTEAVQTLAAEVSQHYDVEDRGAPFEAVIDSATGVGKTYTLPARWSCSSPLTASATSSS
ncbi:MAG TPA: hypothetical protein VIN63_11370 [Candidatus Limnocylindria bacterium]